jgi:hypothetical protein
MSSAVAFLGVVTEDGSRLVLDNPDGFKRAFAKYAADEVVLTVKRRPRRQGDQSMRYYRGVVIPDLAEACGYTDPDEYEAVHDAMAWKFLRLPDGPFGEPRRRSTSKDAMPQDEMTRYIDQVITYAETTIPGCRIRRPEDVDMDRVVDPGWK